MDIDGCTMSTRCQNRGLTGDFTFEASVVHSQHANRRRIPRLMRANTQVEAARSWAACGGALKPRCLDLFSFLRDCEHTYVLVTFTRIRQTCGRVKHMQSAASCGSARTHAYSRAKSLQGTERHARTANWRAAPLHRDRIAAA